VKGTVDGVPPECREDSVARASGFTRMLGVMFGARFDDAETGRSFALAHFQAQIVATDVDDVAAAVRAASQAAASGNWVAGYLAYEAAPAFDAALTVRPGYGGPLAWFGVFADADEVDEPSPDPNASGGYSMSRWAASLDMEAYEASFKAIQRHIEAGDSYQVNRTFFLRAAVSGRADLMYAQLVGAQRPRYAAHLWHDTTHLLSVSPERFFGITNGRITTRPMKGTASRGRWMAEDEEKRQALVDSEKDRAENLMIVDLIRNDLGRIAEFGSVNVDELFSIEKYRSVWQMTSQISASIDPTTELVDVFEALFPCGSVTGAPKARSMEIIADQEAEPRGVYCGAIGFIPPGDGIDGASFNVAIRTAILDKTEGIASYGVGGAITWSSDCASEYDEALTKARLLTDRSETPMLFETIRWDDGYLYLEEHLERLCSSSRYWGGRVDPQAARQLLGGLLDSLTQPSKVRLVCLGDGVAETEVAAAPVRFATHPGPAREPIRLAIDERPIASSDARSFHKLVDRRHFDDRRKRHPYADDVLCVNEHGRITESTNANVAFLMDGTWVTPRMEEGLLPGILRAVLLNDDTIVEGVVTITQARRAEAIGLINSVRGWYPAVLVDHDPRA
jgi:para-aminobenzoate synthetase/4-amino-4-deoxychorismate lyase